MRRSIEVIPERNKASRKISLAIAKGDLTRPETCELCNDTPGKKSNGLPLIVAHHWNGYGDPLDIWWICHTCNMKLKGEEYHNGSVSKPEARQIIADSFLPKPVIKKKVVICLGVNARGERCKHRLSNGQKYCKDHNPAKPKCKAISGSTGLRCARVASWLGYCYGHRKYRRE